jgi:hypothetical protein
MGILTAPLRGLLRIFEEVAERAEEELFGEDAVMSELTELNRSFEAGSLTEEEFARREAELVQRLEEIKERKAGRSSS